MVAISHFIAHLPEGGCAIIIPVRTKEAKGGIMDILKQVSELKEFLGMVYCFLEENEDKLEGVDEFEEIKMKTWDWQQELAKFLPEV